jgi:hypothetical protein
MAQTLIGYGFLTTNYIEFHVSYFFRVGIFLGHVIPATNNLIFFGNFFFPTPSFENYNKDSYNNSKSDLQILQIINKFK